MKYFNTAGPCIPELHYIVDPGSRLPNARRHIDRGQYFVVHAPRQTGKTTTLTSLARDLNAEGQYVALLLSCENAEVAGDDYPAAELQVLSVIRTTARVQLPTEFQPPPWPDAPPGSRIYDGLTAWARHSPRPLVLFFDEIDSLRGESMRSMLRQIRNGFQGRPAAFPASVVLCGLRDVRDYRAASGGDPSPSSTGSTPPRPGRSSPRMRPGAPTSTPKDSRGWSTRWQRR